MAIAEAAEVLRGSKQPLIIVGKGAAYSRGEKEVGAPWHSLPCLDHS